MSENIVERIESKIYNAYISLEGMTPTQCAKIDNGLATLQKDVLKILEDKVVVEKQKLRELADLLKNRPKRHSMPYIPLKVDVKGEWTQYHYEVRKCFEKIEKKFAELGLDTKKETTK